MLVLFLLAMAPPPGFVDLAVRIPTLQEHIGYHTPQNFTGAPLPGYGAAHAWMLAPAAEALAKVQSDLALRGLGLLVYDAYRPQRASRAMLEWAKRENKVELFRQGYIASKSGHNHGHTVDLTLVDLKTSVALDMGTAWDTLDMRANTENASGAALANRHQLRDAMVKRGFRPYAKEWWHFTFPIAGTEPLDVPYGDQE